MTATSLRLVWNSALNILNKLPKLLWLGIDSLYPLQTAILRRFQKQVALAQEIFSASLIKNCFREILLSAFERNSGCYISQIDFHVVKGWILRR